jgi:crossover junction endodeoxyribonuclease RusA
VTTRVVLPWPPSVNRYWRAVTINGKARVLISRDGRAYRNKVFAMTRNGSLVAGNVAITAVAYPPDRRRRDLDNLLKALLDAITSAGLIVDDSLVDDLHIKRGSVVKGGRIVLEIRKLDEGAA